MKKILQTITSGLILAAGFQAEACDKAACRKQAEDIASKLHQITNAEEKAKALQYIDLRNTCGCGVVEGAYANVFPYTSEDYAARIKKFDGTVVDVSWTDAVKNQATTNRNTSIKTAQANRADSNASYEASKKPAYDKMLQDIAAKKSWSEFSWNFTPSAIYRNTSQKCNGGPPVNPDEFLKEFHCSVDEFQADRGSVFFKCTGGGNKSDSRLGVTPFFKDKATCERCFSENNFSKKQLSPAQRSMRGNKAESPLAPDGKPYCYEGLRSQFGK
jgi:hypothetical protein